jgi:hypothetical protein
MSGAQQFGTGIGDLLKDYQDTQAKVAGADLIVNHAHALGQQDPNAPGAITSEDWLKYQNMGSKQRIAFAGGQASLFANDIARNQAKEAAARTALLTGQTAQLTEPPQAFNLPLGPDTSQYIPAGIPPNTFTGAQPGSPLDLAPPEATGLGMGLGPPTAAPAPSMDLYGPPPSLGLGTGQAPPSAPGVDLGAPTFAPQGFQRVTPGASQPVITYRGQMHVIPQPGTPQPIYAPDGKTILGFTNPQTGEPHMVPEAGIEAQTGGGAEATEIVPFNNPYTGQAVPGLAVVRKQGSKQFQVVSIPSDQPVIQVDENGVPYKLVKNQKVPLSIQEIAALKLQGVNIPGSKEAQAAAATQAATPTPKTGQGGYIAGRRYSGKLYLGGDPQNAQNWQ